MLTEQLGIASLPQVEWHKLGEAFEKRYPIAHNLGVVDRKYLERSQSANEPGREVRINATEVEALLDQVLAAVTAVHEQLFSGQGTWPQ